MEIDPYPQLQGTWYYEDEKEPEGRSFFDFGAERFVQFVLESTKPDQRIPMILWYSAEGSGRIRLRPRPESEGWTRDYRFQNGQLVLESETRTWICTRATPQEVPLWFRTALAEFNATGKPKRISWKE